MSTPSSKALAEDPSSSSKGSAGASKTSKGGENKKVADDDDDGDEAALQFPISVGLDDVVAQHLKPFRDESSSYAAVARSCLHLTQFAGSGSCAASDDVTPTTCHNTSAVASSSSLFHDPTYVAAVSAAFAALIGCLRSHRDRRCRILAARALAVAARAAYARIRVSPLLYAAREGHCNRLEDEAGSDVPAALCSAALDDPDDGVAAACIEAVGAMTLSAAQTAGSVLVDDELLREVRAVAFCRASPHAPSPLSVVDEDPAVALQELQARCYENVVAPRLLQLTERVVRFRGPTLAAQALPCLAACLVHQGGAAPSLLFGVDRRTYSKRWSELDAAGLIDAVVSAVLLPAMRSSPSGNLAQVAVPSALRLAHVACRPFQRSSWVTDVARWAVLVLREELSATATIETCLGILSTMIVALRAIPLQERTRTLIWMADEIVALPSTTMAPAGITSCAGLLTEWQGFSAYRRPARIGLWTEIALSFFMDGPVDESHGRSECLKVFLSGPLVASILSSEHGASCTGSLRPRDELLLSFCQVAVQTGRRFRVAADGTLRVADPSHPAVTEWLKLVWVVLTSFVSCPCTGPKTAYLDEDLSLPTAAQVSYAQLLQEYLHFVGLLHPSSSVALKLCANACPPHILWDRMTESAAFLSKFETADVYLSDSNVGQLFDDLIARELGQGIPSHQMRLFVLALAADHWVQGRVAAIRRHHADSDASNGKPDVSALNMSSGREILKALAPKRLLAKISESHVPPVDSDGKPKRDPIKKLALEGLRVSVACIENIALIACDWRRRFGSSSESKHVVSVAVGLLQGKVDETPLDDLMKAVMEPTCEAAVSRIQAFYESGSKGASDQSFPLSELVTHPVKIKIKPLVSSSKPNPHAKDEVMRDYLVQLCCQVVTARTQQAIQSSPPADSMLSPSRPRNWFRLDVPPVPESRDGRLYGNRGDALAAWGKSVTLSSAASDAVQIVLAYTPRRFFRYDGEEEFRPTFLMKAFNMTAVDIVEGLRLEVGVVRKSDPDEEDDPANIEFVESIGCNLEDVMTDLPFMSSATVYNQELKSGEYITWELTLNRLPSASSLYLAPSVVYRNIPVEDEEAGVAWVGSKPTGEGITAGGESKSGEDDFQVTSSGGSKALKGENVEKEDVRLSGELLALSPMLGFQPCPLVFFTDRCGDADSFRFLWFRLPHSLAPMEIAPTGDESSASSPDPTSQKVARMSSLMWDGEAIPGGIATQLWAFMTHSGRRVLCVLTESDSKTSQGQLTLHFRGDETSSLCALAGSKAARKAVVAALLPGMSPVK